MSAPKLQELLPGGITPEQTAVMIASVGAFLTVFFVGRALTYRDNLTGRLKSMNERRAQLKGEAIAPKKRKRQEQLDLMRRIVTRLDMLKTAQSDEITALLLRAGFRSQDAIIYYAFFKLIGGFGLMIASALVFGVNPMHPLDAGVALVSIPGGFYVGMRLPDFYLARKRSKRWARIRQGLPDGLDLMLICAEAGLTLAATLDRVSREILTAYPELGDELSLTSIELGFLPERRMALDNLSARVDIPEVRGIVNVLLQTEKYGTPVAQALRTLTTEYRTQRLLRAEQKAARLPALMTVPMIVFILPCLFIVLLSPAIIQMFITLK